MPIVSRNLATRRKNKILRTPPPPPHISSTREIVHRLTPSTIAQLRTNKSPFFKSYLPSHLFEAFETWLYRKMLRISWKDRVTNDEVYRRMGDWQGPPGGYC